MFYSFSSQQERKNHRRGAFLEMQFCTLPDNTTIENLVCVDNISHWADDSLYIDDENLFYSQYSHIFNCGTYNNLQTGVVDVYGINYYSPQNTDSIIAMLHKEKPAEHEKLLSWLLKAKEYNGFYILGL